MYKKREFIKGAFYHVTSRTNNKSRVFETNLGRRIMLLTLEDAKDKFRFRLGNFCIMPTHFHLLIKPAEGSCLSKIMFWIKIHSAKRWNCIHGSVDHLWGQRFFARPVKNSEEYEHVMNYIDQNPVKAGLVSAPENWKASGAYYKAHKIPNLVDFDGTEHWKYVKLLSPIPPAVSWLLPPKQLLHITQHYGVYADVIEQLYATVKIIPLIGDTDPMKGPTAYLHYFTETADYFIYEYDGQKNMYGKVRLNVFPQEEKTQIFNLSELKNIDKIKLDFSWKA